MKSKKKQTPGMSDAENVFAELEAQEKAERRRLYLEELKKDSESKGGGKEKDSHQG